MKNKQNKLRQFILLSFFITCGMLFSQNDSGVEISGHVYDESGLEMPGVSIFIKNEPGVGTVSNPDGYFTLRVRVGEMVVFRFLGFVDVEYRVTKAEKDLEIILKESTQELDEVVVTGLGTQKKASVVGAISTIAADDLNVPATSINNIIAGRVPGVISMQYSGEPGQNIAEFWVRGIGTFGYNSGALILIDGLEGDLSQLDASDIESFSVLKDAAATAVYGVRGANGVVIVTTKRGTQDRLRITGRVNYTMSHLNRMPDWLDSYDYALLSNEARTLSGLDPLYDSTELELIEYGLDPDLYPNVNWQNEILNRTSHQQTYYVSAQGGGSIARYFMSLGLSNETGAYKQDSNSKYHSRVGYDNFNYRSNLDINLTNSTVVYMGINGYLDNRARPGYTNTDQLWHLQRLMTPITIPTRYSNGVMPAYGEDEYSPYVMLNHTGTASSTSNKSQVTLAIEQDLDFILHGLKLRSQGAIDYQTYKSEGRYLHPEMYYAMGRATTGELQLVKRLDEKPVSYSRSVSMYRKYHFETTANYSATIDEEHDFTGLLYYYMSDAYNSNWALNNLNMIPQRYQGISGRLTYDYKSTYLLDLNFGYTGSENFQPGRRFGFFPSIAGGIVPTNWEFVRQNINWLSHLKLRLSYGSVGNDRIASNRFPYLTLINTSASTGWGFSGSGIIENVIGADNLEWERAIKTNFGVDASLFNDKLSFTIDFFKDTRNNIFQQRTQVPAYVGLINMPFGNVGKMYSYGADGNYELKHSISSDMSFTLRGNFTYSANKVDYWEEPTPLYSYQTRSGLPINYRKGFISLGFFKDDQDVKSSPPQFGSTLRPGDLKYKDVNGDGVVNNDDAVPIAYNNFPRLVYGFGGEFRWKDLTLGLLLKGVGNVEYFESGVGGNGLGLIPFYNGNSGNVLDIVKDQKNRWTPAWYSGDPSTENPDARFPRMNYGGNSDNNARLSTFWKRKGDYLRLQEVNLNYRIRSNKLLNTFGVQSMDVQLVGQNLFSISDVLDYFDPEQAESNGGVYPIPARYSLQFYINF